MKYLFFTCIFCIELLLSTHTVLAVGTEPDTIVDPKTASESKKMKVIVTESIPWGDCKCIEEYSFTTLDDNYWKQTSTIKQNCSNPATRKYSCTVEKWLGGFQKTFASIIKYIIYIVMLLGVLGIVGLGIAWSIAGGDDIKAKTELKKWGVSIIIGLTILFFFSYILRFLAPWIYQ